MTDHEIDALTHLPTRSISCLDDGFVRLVDCYPRLVPHLAGEETPRTLEFRIVESARLSTGAQLKSLRTDVNLLNYLFRNHHTSPFESVKFTFHLRLPKFVRTHFIRHRTANVNEFSQRYSEVKDDAYYHPSKLPDLWKNRKQSSVNKQGSETAPLDEVAVSTKFQEIEGLLDQLYEKYRDLLQLGVPRELARFGLPDACYTEMYWTIDLHNLIHFLELRMDRDHAQIETVIFAEAIYELIKPLVPNVMTLLMERKNGVSLSEREVMAIRNGRKPRDFSQSELKDLEEKSLRLGFY